MTIRHIAGREDWYTITTERARNGRPAWHSRRFGLYGNLGPRRSFEASVEWSLFTRGHGIGVQLGRNGAESHLGFDIYASRLGSAWFRLHSPWTKWTKVRRPPEGAPRDDVMPWYDPRHTGIRLFPWNGCLLEIEIDNPAHSSHRDRAWWHEMKLTSTTILGRTKADTEELGSGPCGIPMPEGIYAATWTRKRYTRRYTARVGRLLDAVRGPRAHQSWSIDVPGGIPVEGKGENSWDCGMDGTFGFSTGREHNLEEAIGALVGSVLRDRERYGGPHHLTRPMTVAEASDQAVA